MAKADKAAKNIRTRMTGFHTDPETRARLEAEATKNGRSVSAHLDLLLRQRYGNPKAAK